MKNLMILMNTKTALIFFALCWMISLQGCMSFYKVRKVNNVTAQEMEKFISQKRFLIIHQDSVARYLSKAKFADNTLTGELVNLSKDQMKFKSTKPKGATRYRNTMRHDEAYVTNEVHLYLKNSPVQNFGTVQKVTISLTEINYTDVYQKAVGRSTFSWVAPGVIGGGAAIVGAAYLLVSLMMETLFDGFDAAFKNMI